jgi:LacI family transcriptional regulator
MKPLARGPRTILLYLDRVAAYTRAMFAGITAYAVEHGPWRFVPVVAPAALVPTATQGRSIDGVIARVVSPYMAESLARLGIPIVNVGQRDKASVLASVCLDDAEVGRVAARYLIQADLKSYAFCGAPFIWYSEPREHGFTEVCKASGHACPSFIGLVGSYLNPQIGRSEQADRLDGWLRTLAKPVGIMACDDTMARQVLDACQRLRLRVPDDVALIGAGNDPQICDLADPPISSIALAADRVGYEAARLLAQLMDGHPAPREPKVFPPAGVVVRFSTKVAASADVEVAQAIDFIRDRVSEGITVDDVLDVVPLSRRTLEMRFRATIGRSPAEEIRRVRIERAKRLLVETDAGMASVAHASGFSSANQLCETFRREAGLSPTRYRRQFRGRGD